MIWSWWEIPKLLEAYNTVKNLLSESLKDKKIDLDLLTESISKASENKKSVPKQKDKDIKGFNLKN